MLKKFCILVTVIACVIGIVGCAWGGVSLSAFPDPAFREYLKRCDSGWIEYDAHGFEIRDASGNVIYFGKDNGILDDKEIEHITCLEIDELGINSLKGIEHLTALTKLYCHNNQLTELDVSGCTALTILGCDGNLLTELDVSHNIALEQLSCMYMGYKGKDRLKKLNVSNCTALTYLNCSCNHLEKLDASDCSALTNLDCHYNKLMNLNVSGCSALRELICYHNQLTELDLSKNTLLGLSSAEYVPQIFREMNCSSQEKSGLKLKKTSEGYEVHLKDYVSYLENIDDDSIWPKPVSYNKETGIAIFSWPITSLSYKYDTHSSGYCKNVRMSVRITNKFSVSAIESPGYYMICNMTDNSYLDSAGKPIDESAVYWAGNSLKQGIAADGNSRLILCVRTDKPGTVSFSFNDDIGAKLESLSRKELSASDQLATTEINSDIHQVSAVLVAPERFPESKLLEFPYTTFKVHVKFTDEDGEVTENDLELKIEAAPVVLIPDELDANSLLYSGYSNAKKIFGVNDNIGIWRELLKIGFEKERIALLDYNSSTGVKDNVNSLFTVLENTFASYAKDGIVCTKADVVAYGFGGLLVRQFLDESGKDSSSDNNNNWSEISYKQGMIHKIVNIAVPHRGTPVANVMLGDMSVIKNDLPPGIDRLAYRILKYFPGMCTDIYATTPQWKDLAVGSDVVNLPFPANVPMHFIYGDVTYSLDKLENMKNLLFFASGICKIIKAFGSNITKYQDLTDYLEDLDILKEFTRLQGKYLDSFQLLKALAMLDNEVLRVVAEQREIIMDLVKKVIKDFGIPFAEMASDSPTFTGLMQIGDVAMGGAAGLLKTPIDLYFVIQRLIFSGQPHDLFVPKWSAIAAFPEYSTCFPVTPDIFDLWHFKYGEICHQAGVAEFVGYLLKAAPMSEFAVLKESVALPGSRNALPETLKARSTEKSNADREIDFDNFYVSNFDLTIRKSTREVFSNGMTALKFIAKSSVKINSDAKLVIQKDGLDRIFPMFTDDGYTFEAIIVFQSGDEGALTAYGYAPSDKGNLCISNTVEFSYLDMFEDEEPENTPTPPEIKTETLTNAITGQTYSYHLTASGTAPITWTKSGTLPKGLTLNSSGLISGTPTKAGKSSFTVTAKNSYGKASRKFTINVLEPVSITTASLKAGTIGKSYSVTLKAKGSKTITWSAEGLPNGLTMNEKGKISGKPTVYGNFTVKITAGNEAGSVVKSFPLEIKAIAPKLSGTLAKPALNEPYSSALKVTGSEPITWSITGTLPDGLTFDTSTGKISGTPTIYAKSGWKIIITATNDAGKNSKNITLKVNATAPKITAKLPGATAGENYSAKLTATGSEAITFTADLPEYLTLDGNVIAGNIPESIKSFKIKVYASNPVKTVSKTYTIKVSKKKKTTREILKAENDTDIMKNDTALNTEVIADMPVNSEIDADNNSGYVTAVELGEVSCDLPGMYDFNVELPYHISEGSELVYTANSDRPSEDDSIAEFYDDAGNEISVVPENRRITISIWLNPETIYNPVISVKH